MYACGISIASMRVCVVCLHTTSRVTVNANCPLVSTTITQHAKKPSIRFFKLVIANLNKKECKEKKLV
jgi:hypothetical protein